MAALTMAAVAVAQPGAPVTGAGDVMIEIEAVSEGKTISSDLIGVFFEDINYAADGGLYAEMVQNRSFEYNQTDNGNWNHLTCWKFEEMDGGRGSLPLDTAFPLNPNNPHYVDLEKANGEGSVSLTNEGFDGFAVEAGETYDLSFFARQLYIGGRWGSLGRMGDLPLSVQLTGADGAVLAETTFEISVQDWRRFEAELIPTATGANAKLVLIATAQGGIALDEISLFPRKTFKGHHNGLRADLAQAIADLHPKFVRFPGGCLVHGDGLGNMYRWKDTIGPVEARRQQRNIWGYHQSAGLGYFEYFQFCEDIGAKPFPILPAGVCCQNSGHTGGGGQQGLPFGQMGDYIQETLDLIEWANGPADSEWGAKRAAAGHPEPFGLEYVGVGNEEHITPVFKVRFAMIYRAIQEKYPEIKVIGTSGPFHSGEDYEKGWAIAGELEIPVIDEHYYVSPQWFWDNLMRYDAYDREKSVVYLGEYAAHERDRRNTLRSALAEAACLTALERNADMVHFASYAPLLSRRGHTQWTPDMIYFTNTQVVRTLNYHVQSLFGANAGDVYVPVTVNGETALKDFTVSTVRESESGDLIVKLVNGANAPRTAHIALEGAKKVKSKAELTVLASADPMAVNDYDNPDAVVPAISVLKTRRKFDYEVPANSLSVIRLCGVK